MIANCKLVDMPQSDQQVVHRPLLQSCLNEVLVFHVALRLPVTRSAQRVRQFGSKTCLVQWFSYFRVVANSILHKLHQQNQQDVQIYNNICMTAMDICVCMSGWQSMVNDQMRARQRILEIQCFVRNKVFVRQGFVQ